MASASLTPLLKPDNGIRPIAVGAIWRRLASKVAMRGVRKEMSKYLRDFQFGVGVPKWGRGRIPSYKRFGLDARLFPYGWIFLYGQSARLYVGDDHILSTTGVQQGDPLGPLLFALVLYPLVHRIRDCCQLLFHAWYLDDGEGRVVSPCVIGRRRWVLKLLGGAWAAILEFALDHILLGMWPTYVGLWSTGLSFKYRSNDPSVSGLMSLAPFAARFVLDSFGGMPVHCNELLVSKYRESTFGQLIYLSFGWAGGKNACVDLTGVSPPVGLRDKWMCC
ncbi:hypothetical protein Tco_1106604 [Tanacetum coccineum]